MRDVGTFNDDRFDNFYPFCLYTVPTHRQGHFCMTKVRLVTGVVLDPRFYVRSDEFPTSVYFLNFR